MRRAVITLMTVGLLVAGASPVASGQSEAPTEAPIPVETASPAVAPTETPVDGATQRVELPDAGIAVSFPADWNVRIPMSRRVSDVPAPEDAAGPAYETTIVWAVGEDERWCDIDMYDGVGLTLEEHAMWLQQKLQSVFKLDRFLEATKIDLPVGPAYRIDMDDEVRTRSWRMYLFERGSEQYLLSCADQLNSTEDWMSVATSIESLASSGG